MRDGADEQAAVLFVAQLAEGFGFQLPGGGLTTAVAVFGITSMGRPGTCHVPVLVRGKGLCPLHRPYRRLGGLEAAGAWLDPGDECGHYRVDGDLHGVATLAFYLLGAGVLHTQGLLPKGQRDDRGAVADVRETLGPWALWLFTPARSPHSTAPFSRRQRPISYADMVSLLGVFDRGDYATRVVWRKRFVVGLLLIPVGLYFLKVDPSKW